MDFKKITEVESLSKVPANAMVLGVVDGAIKQMPTDGMGGGGSVAESVNLVITYENDVYTANMTKAEAISKFDAGVLLGGMLIDRSSNYIYGYPIRMIFRYNDQITLETNRDEFGYFSWNGDYTMSFVEGA